MPTNTHGHLKAGRTLAVLAGLISIFAIAFLTWNVAREIREQGSAQSDNVQWALSQVEVEFQEFSSRSRIGADLASVRRRFDVFYSRIRTVRSAQVFGSLRESEEFIEHLTEIEAFLEETVPIIDSDDINLTAQLPTLAAMSQDVRPHIRSLSNSGLRLFAERADEQREAVARTMTQLAIAVAALISALGFGVIYLNRLNLTIARREDEQAQTATRINTIMSTSLDGVIVSNSDGRITDFNGAAETIFGHKAEDVVGKELGQIIVPDHLRELHDAGMERMRRGGEKRVVGKGRVQLEAKRSDGSIFPVELAIQSATTDDGDIFIAFLRDVSQRVADEAELIEARDKAIAGEQARSEFLATMSHEIRTPLNGLLGNMTLMRDTPLSAIQDTYLRNMETSGRLLLSHVSDVLDIARYDSGRISARSEPLNLSALLQDIVDSQSGMALAQNTSLDWGWAGEPQNWINGDPDRLQHVLMNLVGNAVKFTKGGRVSVTVKWAINLLTIEIEDTGIGISEDMIDHIFEDFVTGNTSYDREVSGTGLGLSIVKRFVEALHGRITVSSTEGEGSIFTVELPATAAKPEQPKDEVHTTMAPLPQQRILVVEDNDINRFVVRSMLEADGHHVTEAVNGHEGVVASNAERFDLILMDISMPVLDGRAATTRIKEGNGASKDTRIVALTANVLPEERADFLAHGMEDVLTKPLSRDALRTVLGRTNQPDHQSHAVSDIDQAHLRETLEMLGTDGFATILSKFDTEAADFMAWATPERPADELAKEAHKVAGAAAVFGATGFREALLTLEQAAKAGDHSKIDNLLTEARTKGEATRQHLNNASPSDQE